MATALPGLSNMSAPNANGSATIDPNSPQGPSFLQSAYNVAKSDLPANMWAGNPIGNALGLIVPNAYAAGSSPTNVSTAPTGGSSSSNTTYTPNQGMTQDQKNAAFQQAGLGQIAPVGWNPSGGSSAPTLSSVQQQISDAWNGYLGSLGGVGTDLQNSANAQNGIADTQLSQAQNVINQQKAQSLRDIGNTTRSAFQAGNNYLGSMGAGDSSAANQYSFAVQQQANKQMGDLNNFVNGQLGQLQSTHDTQIGSIAQWLAQQQQALQQQVAQGTLQKGTDIANSSQNYLNQALAWAQQVKQNTQNQYNALVQWAANNSANVGQLQQNIAQIPQAMGQISLFGGNQATPTYGGAPATNTPTNPYTGLSTSTDIFGNPIKQ